MMLEVTMSSEEYNEVLLRLSEIDRNVSGIDKKLDIHLERHKIMDEVRGNSKSWVQWMPVLITSILAIATFIAKVV